MKMTRFVRTLVSVVMLGLGGSLLGCSGELGSRSTPPDQETSKKIAAEMKNAALERKAAQSQAAKERMKGGGRR